MADDDELDRCLARAEAAERALLETRLALDDAIRLAEHWCPRRGAHGRRAQRELDELRAIANRQRPA